jgi:hypothetical protein
MKQIFSFGLLILVLAAPGECFSNEYTQHHQKANQAFNVHTSGGTQSKIGDNVSELSPVVQGIINKVMGGGGVSNYTQGIADRLFPNASNYTPQSNLPTPIGGGGGMPGSDGGMPESPF